MSWPKITFRRVIIDATTDTAGKVKRFDATGLEGETFKDREFFQQFGFTSKPRKTAEGIVFGIGNVMFLIATEDRDKRPALTDDLDSALYSDADNFVLVKANGAMKLKSSVSVTVETPTVIVKAATKIELGEGALGKVVTTESTCAYTGGPHPAGCTKVFAKI